MNKNLVNMFFLRKGIIATTLFKKLKENQKLYIYQYYKYISKKLNTSEAFVRNTIKLFYELGLIAKTKNGRKVFITLTEEGENLLKDIYKLYKKVKSLNKSMNNNIYNEKQIYHR